MSDTDRNNVVPLFGEKPDGPLDSLMAEALSLAEDARAFIGSGATNAEAGASHSLRLAHAEATSRITARVTHAIAWILARRAVAAGEITPEEARTQRWRLGGRAVCEADNALPIASHAVILVSLDQRSRDLYERVSRLDRALDAGTLELGNELS